MKDSETRWWLLAILVILFIWLALLFSARPSTRSPEQTGNEIYVER